MFGTTDRTAVQGACQHDKKGLTSVYCWTTEPRSKTLILHLARLHYIPIHWHSHDILSLLVGPGVSTPVVGDERMMILDYGFRDAKTPSILASAEDNRSRSRVP